MDRPPIDVDAVRAALTPRWAQIDVVNETASTNADLLVRAGAADRTALVAEHQTAGRGRFDRSWTSPARAGLTFSALFRPPVPLARWGWLPLLAGLAVAEAITDTVPDTALKWPNDVLIGGAKVAGILAQTADDAVVIGIGCNVSTTRDELPTATSTSLRLAGAGIGRDGLLIAILTRLDARVAQWADCVGDAEACGLATAYRDRCATIGRPARVTVAGGTVLDGVVETVDGNGHLVLRTSAGTHVVAAGDVEHLRPA